MSTKLKALKNERDQVIRQLERFRRHVESFADSPEVTQLQLRLKKAETYLDIFNNIQLNIETLDEEELTSNQRQQFEDMYYGIIASAKTTLTNMQETKQDIKITQISSENTANIKLPTLSLPTFQGNYDQWLLFKDSFTSLIHANDSLTNIQKFQYLRSSLRGEALQLLRALETSAENYEIAWNLLHNRFENKRLIINTHMKGLVEISSVHKESHVSLRQFIDGIQTHTRALQSLQQPVKEWDTILIYLLTNKLDIQTRKEWETNTGKRVDMPTLNELISFLEDKCQTLEMMDKVRVTDGKSVHKKIEKSSSFTTTARLCEFCKKEHFIYGCQDLLKLAPASRLEEIKKLKLCLNCFRPGHIAVNCRSSNCKTCGKKHNTLLHIGKSEQPERTSNENEEKKTQDSSFATHIIEKQTSSILDDTAVATHIAEKKTHILLSTASVLVYDGVSNTHEVRALLDSGSQANFITKNLCKKLNLPVSNAKRYISGINQMDSHAAQETRIKIKSKWNNFHATLNCLALERITDNLPQIELNTKQLNIPEGITLADESFGTPGAIELLIGAELFWKLLCIGQIALSRDQPLLQKTQLGWIISGAMKIDTANPALICHFTKTVDLNTQLERFWTIEEPQVHKIYSPEENYCENHFVENYSRNVEGRFIVRLPKRQGILLGDSLETATSRLHWLERKLQKRPELKVEYDKFLEEYLKLNHMTKLEYRNGESINKEVFYLPHHPVEKKDSLTTKVRVVFDGSCKTTSKASLNDLLMVGPCIQEDLFNIIVRFRIHQVVLTADIAMMYRQVLVDERDRHLQRIVWRKHDTEEISTYTLNTITYGTSTAPFLATRCLKELAVLEGNSYPKAREVLERDFYMDDVLTGTSTDEQAIKLRQELTLLLEKGKFSLRKWRSNSIQVQQDLEQNQSDGLLLLTKQEPLKTLGLYWDAQQDHIQYCVRITHQAGINKRSILSQIAQIFDPLGLIGPILTNAKYIMQQLWQLQIGWDESLPQSIYTTWIDYYEDLHHINRLRVTRNINPGNSNDYINIEGFCDASEKAYGACIYATSTNKDGDIISKLICSKSRIAPLKSVTLPRLELNGALLLAKLLTTVRDALKGRIKNIRLWTDSTITLAWINTEPHKLKTYVSNRVAEIQQITENITWYHISSSNNPADLLSRGCTTEQLLSNGLWWRGPSNQQLELELENQPQWQRIDLDVKSKISLTAVYKPPEVLEKYSSLKKLQRIIAYCNRFIDYSRKQERKEENLTTRELEKAMKQILLMVQKETFALEFEELQRNKLVSKKSCLLQLNPFIGEDGLIRVGGRLQKSDITNDHKHPVVLPSNHFITKLIFREKHLELLHCGPEQLLATIRLKYWPLSGRTIARQTTKQCIPCFRHKPTPSKYIMGNLPSERICGYSRPFTTCGVDYAGPIHLKEARKSRGRQNISKGYIAVFICFTTKAVHLELVSSLTTEAFLAALKRFFARRGVSSQIFSDNATNFTAANKELKEIYELVNTNYIKIASELANRNIEWKFIPPRSPNFGGLWESCVKSVKRHFNRVVRNLTLTFEECYTLLTGIESVLNSRPLVAISSDPNDYSVLTPSHFLVGDSLLETQEPDWNRTPDNKLSRWQHLQKVKQHFWQRWYKEYLHQLQVRQKWNQETPPITEGTLVLLIEDNLPSSQWILGRVITLYPGPDNVTRVVLVKTASGTYKRALRKLCALPIEKDN